METVPPPPLPVEKFWLVFAFIFSQSQYFCSFFPFFRIKISQNLNEQNLNSFEMLEVLWKVPKTINNTSNLFYHFLILFNINSWITRFLKLLYFKEYNFANLHMVSLLTKLIFLYCINSNEIILVKNKKWILNFACSRKKTFAF